MLQMKAYVRMAVWFMSIGKMEISMISSVSGGCSARTSSDISTSISISVPKRIFWLPSPAGTM